MSIIGMFSGVRKARKVAASAARLWQDTVNYLVLGGRELKWEDSARLLSAAYCLAVFRFACKNLGKSSDLMGTVIVETSKLLGDTLRYVWGRQMPQDEIEKVVREIVNALPGEYHEWQSDVLESCHAVGMSPPVHEGILFERAVALYLDNICDWHSARFGAGLTIPDKSELHRAVSRNLNDIS